MGSMSTDAAPYAPGAIAPSIGLVALLHRLEPEFDPSWRMLSEYSLPDTSRYVPPRSELPAGATVGRGPTAPE